MRIEIPELSLTPPMYTKLWSDKKELHDPFDIIGDVHGCIFELKELL